MTHKSAKLWFTWPFMQLFANRILHTILHCARCFFSYTPLLKFIIFIKNHKKFTAIEFYFWSQNYQKLNSFLINTQIQSVMTPKSNSRLFRNKTCHFWTEIVKNAAFMSFFDGKNTENVAFLRYAGQIDKYVKLVVMYVIFIERRNDFKQKLSFLNFWS